MRDLRGVIARLMTKDRDEAEAEAAREQQRQSRAQAAEDAALARSAMEISDRLRRHRAENHFARRFEDALRERRP